MRPSPVTALILADIARSSKPQQPARRHRRPGRRRALAVAIALFTLLAGASRAVAAVDVKFNDQTDTINAAFTANNDVARIWRDGDHIRVNGAIAGSPTVTTTDLVVFYGNPDINSTVIVDLRGGPFSPGQGWEQTTPEIEFSQQLGTGTDALRFLLAEEGDTVAVGTGGVNLDPEEGVPADVEFESLVALETISLQGGAGADTITGAGGPDRVGGPAIYALTISGGGGEDDLTGGAGNDTITGGAGVDQIDAGAGNDRIEVRDGAIDEIACGAGADTVRADEDDIAAADCETVIGPSSGGTPPPPNGQTPPPPPNATPTVRLGKPRLERGRATLAVTCSGAPCAGRIVIKAGRKVIARGRYRAAAGTTVKARAKLTRRGKALLKRKRQRAKVRVTVAGGTPVARTVRLRRT